MRETASRPDQSPAICTGIRAANSGAVRTTGKRGRPDCPIAAAVGRVLPASGQVSLADGLARRGPDTATVRRAAISLGSEGRSIIAVVPITAAVSRSVARGRGEEVHCQTARGRGRCNAITGGERDQRGAALVAAATTVLVCCGRSQPAVPLTVPDGLYGAAVARRS